MLHSKVQMRFDSINPFQRQRFTQLAAPFHTGSVDSGQWAVRAGFEGKCVLTCDAHATNIGHMSKMIQLRNVPDSLHRQLKARAALAGMALSDFLIREVRKIAEYPTPEEMRERLSQRESYRGRISPTDIVRSERDSR